PQQGGDIAGDIDDLGYSRRAEEIKTKETYKQKNHEATRTRPKETIREANAGADQNRDHPLLSCHMERSMDAAQVFLFIGIDGKHNQNKRQQLAHEFRRDMRNSIGPDESKGKSSYRCRYSGTPLQLHAPSIAQCCSA